MKKYIRVYNFIIVLLLMISKFCDYLINDKKTKIIREDIVKTVDFVFINFKTLSKAMSLYDEVELEETGRMADFTKWGYAIAEAAGIGGENFLQAYLNNQRRANLEAIESNPVGAAVVKLMENRHLWTGSVTDLHTLLNHVAVKEGINTINKQWPSQPNILSRRLKEIKSNLEDVGINYDIRHHSNAKMITIQNRFIKTNTVQAPKKFLKEDIGEIEI